MTELTDFFKVWFSHVAECFDPATGEKVEDDNPQTIWTKAHAAFPDRTAVVSFKVTKPANLTWPEILQNLKAQSYVRALVPESPEESGVHRVDDLLTNLKPLAHAPHLFVVQDRVTLSSNQKSRFLEAVETALHFGHGQVFLFTEGARSGQLSLNTDSPAEGIQHPVFEELGHYSQGLHSPKSDRTFRAATPALFSFNSPLGACPTCRGFGRIIEIDYRLAMPDHSLSIDDGAIKCWESEVYGDSMKDLLAFAK